MITAYSDDAGVLQLKLLWTLEPLGIDVWQVVERNDPAPGSIVAASNKLRRLSPDTEATRRVQNLVEERRKLIDEKTEQINRLTSHLKIYFPQMLDWFDRLDREAAYALLERWPTLQEWQKVSAAKLRMFSASTIVETTKSWSAALSGSVKRFRPFGIGR